MSTITRISTPHSYATAVVAGDYAFIGLHRGFGESFVEQFEGTFAGLQKTFADIGVPLENMVKVTVWLKHIKDLPEMEQLFNNYFSEGDFPARMTATTEFIDEDCLLMIDGMAYLKV